MEPYTSVPPFCRGPHARPTWPQNGRTESSNALSYGATALLCSLLLVFGQAQAALGQPLWLTPTVVQNPAQPRASRQPVSGGPMPLADSKPAKPTNAVFLGRIALVPRLPALSAAPFRAAKPNLAREPRFEHSPLADSLLTTPFNTTADLSTGLRVQSVTAAASGFTGIPPVLGAGLPSVRGAVASLSPSSDGGETLTLTGASLYEPDQRNLYGLGAQQAQSVLGRTWALTSDNLFLHRKLRIRAQYVRTDSISNNPTAPSMGEAYDIGVAMLTPRGPRLYEDWNFEVHHARIGPRLWTPRNPGLTKGVSIWQANASRRRGNLALAVACTDETQSANSSGGTGAVQLQTWEGRLQYALSRRWISLYWLGRPTVALNVERQHWQAVGAEQTGFANGGTTLTTEDVNMVFRPPAPFSWHMNTSWTTGPQTYTRRYELGMTVSPGAGLRFAPIYVLQSTRSQTQTAPSQIATGIVQARVPLLNGKASLQFDAEVDRLDVGQNPDRNWQRSINGQLVWRAITPHGQRPAVTVGVSGTQQWTSAAPGTGNWQVLASVNVLYSQRTD